MSNHLLTIMIIKWGIVWTVMSMMKMNVDKIFFHLKIFRELKILCWKFLQINFLLYLSISFNQNIKTLWQKNQQRKQLRRLRKLLRRRSNQQSWYFQKGSNLGSLPFFFFISFKIPHAKEILSPSLVTRKKQMTTRENGGLPLSSPEKNISYFLSA